MILDLLMGIIGLGFSLIALILRIVFACIAGLIAAFKRRSPLLWGGATFIFPWIFFVILFMPKKYPKFQSYLAKEEAFSGKNPVIASIMALAAMIAKADGNVTRDEITFVKKFISSHFGIYGEALDSYATAFDYGKNHPEAYLEFTGIITQFYGRRDMVIALAYLFVSMAMQGEGMSSQEDEMIQKILKALGLTEYEYISLKNSFTYQQNTQQQSYGGYQHYQSYTTQASSAQLTAKYCEVLGVDESADMNTIKKAYRKLVKEYHPDKLASESMPKEYEEFAKQKIIEINEAYEYLKKIKEN